MNTSATTKTKEGANIADQPADDATRADAPANGHATHKENSVAPLSAKGTASSASTDGSPLNADAALRGVVPSAPNTSTPAAAAAPPPSYPSSPVPLLLLGGGGYDAPSVARAYTALTAAACCLRLPSSVPESDAFYPSYLSTGFESHTRAKPRETRPNRNDAAHLNQTLRYVRDACERRRKRDSEEEDTC